MSEPLARDTRRGVIAAEGKALRLSASGVAKEWGCNVMNEIDPIGGFRVVRPDPDCFEDQIRPRRRRSALAFGFLALAVGLPLLAPVIAFIW
jgi:hypothetical protein